jgi:hypothetical protein
VAGNLLKGEFYGPVASTPEIRAEIKTDTCADENRYLFRDRLGNVVRELGPYPGGASVSYTEWVQLEANQIYGFEIVDLWGNGISDPYTSRGSCKLYTDKGKLLAQFLLIADLGEKTAIQTTLPPASSALPGAFAPGILILGGGRGRPGAGGPVLSFSPGFTGFSAVFPSVKSHPFLKREL